MAIDPVKIPQNVYIEDRIVGPLTLKQTLIMAAGGGFSYALYGTISKAYGSVSLPVTILVWIPAVIAVAFALIKINDLSLTRICFLLLEKFHKPATRTWTPRRGISINIRTHVIKEDTEKLKEHAEEQAKSDRTKERIKELSSILDQGTEALDEETIHEFDDEPLPRRPVDPGRISIDDPEDEPPASGMSDLSVFRDIFPPHN
ncbi:PrgI family protein [Candidatus Peregrinibacteria bacterium]|nr:PrgI family protein [Candidatus Peregrinibacteria bacterium]